MKKYILYYIAAVFCAAALWACTDEPLFRPEQYLEVDKMSLVAPAAGASYQLKVNSNTSWTASLSDEVWAKSSVGDFVGETDVTVTINRNEGGLRSCTLVIESEDKSICHKIRILQKGVDEDGFIRIRTLRAMAESGSFIFPDEVFRTKGIVTTNSAEGNFYKNAIVVQDDFTETESAIFITLPEDAPMFVQGEEVSVNLRNVRVGRNEYGFLSVELTEMPEPSGITPLDLEPLPVAVEDLDNPDYEAMYVEIDEVQIAESLLGSTYGSSPTMMTTDFASFKMKVFESAVFAETACPDGGGYVRGIASSGKLLFPTSESDIVLGENRLEINALSELPYMFSLYCTDGGNNNSYKYIGGEAGQYDDASYIREIRYFDIAKPSVVLTSRMAGLKEEQTRATLIWANKWGYDNIPAKSFVSEEYLESQSVSVENGTGYTLTLPLAMDLPERFSVTLGMYLQDTFSDWKVEYSNDGKEWHGFDRSGSKGCFTVPAKDLFYYASVVFDSVIDFREGDILYIRISPTGMNLLGSGGPWNKDSRLVSGIYVGSAMPQNTDVPEGAVWFEPFDALTEGVDYKVGQKLGAMDNVGGSDIMKWTEEQRGGMTGENVVQRPGYAQIGWVNIENSSSSLNLIENNLGTLVTPKLGKEGRLEVSFDAMGYRTNKDRANMNNIADKTTPDVTSFIVEVTGGGTIGGAESAVFNGLTVTDWKEFDFVVENATADTRLKFTSPGDAAFTRWFIDNILVK